MTNTVSVNRKDVRMGRTKQEIRAMAKQRRHCLTTEERVVKSRCICSFLLDILNGSVPVMVYVAKRPEVETGTLITGLIARGTRLLSLSSERRPSAFVCPIWRILQFSSTAPSMSRNPSEARSRRDQRRSGLRSSPSLPLTGKGNRLGYRSLVTTIGSSPHIPE